MLDTLPFLFVERGIAFPFSSACQELSISSTQRLFRESRGKLKFIKMEASHFCPPVDAHFHIGCADDSKRISPGNRARWKRSGGGHRPFNKNRPLKCLRVNREMLQKSIALRSSALRQAKLAEARTGPHSNEFDAVQAAAKKACSSPIVTTKLTHINAGKRRKITSSCTEQETPYAAASVRGLNMPIFSCDIISENTGSAKK